MESLRVEATSEKQRPVRRRSSSKSETDPVTTGAQLRWVTARVPFDLVRQIEAHAKRSGATRSEAIRECLTLGIETLRNRDGVPGGRVEELLGAIESVRVLLELLGPATFGTQRLLAHWASRDSAVKVSEEELVAEVRLVSAEEWEQAVSDAERELSSSRDAAGNSEER